jgi:hypothetical protein
MIRGDFHWVAQEDISVQESALITMFGEQFTELPALGVPKAKPCSSWVHTLIQPSTIFQLDLPRLDTSFKYNPGQNFDSNHLAQQAVFASESYYIEIQDEREIFVAPIILLMLQALLVSTSTSVPTEIGAKTGA